MESVYTEESVKRLSEAEFYERFGVGPVFFEVLLDRLKQCREEEHAKGGRPNRLSVFQSLIIFFLYIRQYMTQTILADMTGVKKWDVSRAYHWVLDTLIRNGCFHLVGNRKIGSGTFALIDVTEIFIQRPKRNQKKYYSGKKKRHTMKVQIIYDLTANKIVSFYISNGTTHDFKMFKESSPRFREFVKGLADSGYQGILKVWHTIETPHKKPRGGELSDEEKEFNALLGSIRVAIEHVNAWIKRFRMIKHCYRGNIRDLWKIILVVCFAFNIECPGV